MPASIVPLRSSSDRHRRVGARIRVFALVGVLALVVSACDLKTEAAKIHVLIGAGDTNPDNFADPQFGPMLAQQFNSLSPENELKWSFNEPQQGVYDFSKLDQLVNFAKQNNMVVKGGGLISGCCNPSWLTQITDPNQLLAAMTEHFTTLMQRYSPTMDRWDVMTEALSINGSTGNGADSNGLVENYFYRVLGPDYIADAFRIAHAAVPSAKLLLNESLVESNATKRQEFYNLVSGLVAQGVPITGVGLEMHLLGGAPAPGVITDMVNSYKALGLEVDITELDAQLAGQKPDADALEGQMYAAVINEALHAGIRDISFWGFTDKYCFPYFTGGEPCMFDTNYSPKPAFFSTWAALHQFGIQTPAG